LSKALGTAGGFVCGSGALVDWLANRARTYVFSTAQPAATSAAAIAALAIVEEEPHRRADLLKTAAEVRTRLEQQGWALWPPAPTEAKRGRSSGSQIIPLYVGEPERALKLAVRLQEAGFFVPAIRPPTVPAGQSLLRLSLCWHHTPPMIDALVDSLGRVR
jgi:8-amino-7-oxononanoate synthase